MKKGYVMTLDSIFAMLLVFFSIFIFSFYHFSIPAVDEMYFEYAHMHAEDALQVLDNKGVLNEVGHHWAINDIDSANKTAARYLNVILPERLGYRMEINDVDITSRDASSTRGDVPEGGASDKTKATRVISGYAENKTWVGYMARAMLLWNKTNITEELSHTPHGAKHLTLNISFDDPGYADPAIPNFREEETLWLTLPMGVTVTEARLNVSAGT
ncbi:MAG: hypothetical protein U9M95_02565 [Candidatus Altiarchaeota archaeon]|nr:hypothetical protein [Candidatus Altiarchaeota archaeon]